MNAVIQINIRDRLELRISAGESIHVFNVRVQDIVSDGIMIDRPATDDKMIPAVRGKAVEIVFSRQDATYRFDSLILREDYLGRLPVLVISQPLEFKRIQRREYFRLEIGLPIRFRRLSILETNPFSRGRIVNLSAGGVKFRTEPLAGTEIFNGDTLLMSFNLTDTYSVAGLEGKVLSVNVDTREQGNTEISCRFLNIPLNLQEAIIAHNIRYQQRYRIEPKGRQE